jgi:site-specific recombinase XerD
MRRWDGLMEDYVAACRARGLAESTVAGIRSELERWGLWLKRRRPRPALEAVDAELVVAYLRARMRFRAKATLSGRMSILRGMGEHLVSRGVWTSSPLRWLQGPRLDARMRVPRRIGREHMAQLWAAAGEHRSPYQRHLWTAVLAVLYGTGLRRGELSRLDVASWRGEESLLVVDGRKTGRMRHVLVPALTRQCLEAYLPRRHNQLERQARLGETALFVNQHGMRLAGEAVSVGVHKLTRRAGLEGVTVHAFRHSCASDLLEAGVGLPEVQQVLGHREVSTTVRYLAIADTQRQAAIRRHPVNDWLGAEEAA